MARTESDAQQASAISVFGMELPTVSNAAEKDLTSRKMHEEAYPTLRVRPMAEVKHEELDRIHKQNEHDSTIGFFGILPASMGATLLTETWKIPGGGIALGLSSAYIGGDITQSLFDKKTADRETKILTERFSTAAPVVSSLESSCTNPMSLGRVVGLTSSLGFAGWKIGGTTGAGIGAVGGVAAGLFTGWLNGRKVSSECVRDRLRKHILDDPTIAVKPVVSEAKR